jgi:hypothetical protein
MKTDRMQIDIADTCTYFFSFSDRIRIYIFDEHWRVCLLFFSNLSDLLWEENNGRDNVHCRWSRKNTHFEVTWGWRMGSFISWVFFGKKIHFWPSNFCLSLVLAIELQNRISLTIQLLKPFTIDHQTVLMGGFNFFIYNLVLRTWNDHYFLPVALI